MCGFSGILNYDEEPVSADVIVRMTDLQRHRGPDDQAFCLFDLGSKQASPFSKTFGKFDDNSFSGALGFNRLSILDLSDRGRQPMSSDGGKIQLVLNGEIYNSPSLRHTLASQGIKFQSGTDTEVVLHWYCHYGWESLLENIEGMFSLCLVDLNRGKCLLARDHFGIKPLYITFLDGTVLFASEAKSFLAHPKFKFEISRNNLDEFLLFRSLSGGSTLMKGVHMLLPGHWIDISHADAKAQCYWSASDADEVANSGQMFVDELRRSVEEQMLSDVPVGCQLSGGVDSSVVNKFAADFSPTKLNAISVILDDPAFSEEPWIDEAAEKAGVQVSKHKMDADWFAENFLRASWHLDQPINHPNTLGILFLANQAKKEVRVLLSGEGADELMAGYPRFFYQLLSRRFSKLFGLLSRTPKIGKWVRRKFLTDYDGCDRFIMSTSRMGPEVVRQLFPEFDLERGLRNRRRIFANTPGKTVLQRLSNFEMSTYLQEMLVRQDKMTMAESVENRVPFLSRRLFNFIRSLPDKYMVSAKFGFGKNVVEKNTKVVLKTLAASLFGARFSYRKKSGFGLPLRDFLQTPKFAHLIQALLAGIEDRGIFEVEFVKRTWGGISATSDQELEALWLMFSFEAWAGQCDGSLDRKMKELGLEHQNGV